MGSFLTNYQVRTDSEQDVIRELKQIIKSRAHVSTCKNGWVAVYDETSESQDQTELHRLAKEISGRMSCATFAFLVHDSDVLVYLLYDCGKLIDEYNSKPDYFGPADEAVRQCYQGRPELVLKFCRSGTQQSEVEAILGHSTHDERHYGSEEDRLRELAGLLDIDEDRACIGFNYYERGDLGDTEGFRAIGKPAAEVRQSLPDNRLSESLAAIKKLPLERLRTILKDSRVAQALLLAAMRADENEVVRLVLDAVDPRVRRSFGGEPLWMAAAMGKAAAVQALIAAGADLDGRHNSGTTALEMAVLGNHVEAVRHLVAAGADVNAKGAMGLTVLEIATKRNNAEILCILHDEPPKK